jgi:hypothetical protein
VLTGTIRAEKGFQVKRSEKGRRSHGTPGWDTVRVETRMIDVINY